MITARAIGSVGSRAPARRRSCCSQAYARAVSTTWRCQPGNDRPFEMIEAEFVLQLLVLLLDRPALMRESHQGAQRGGGRQRDEVGLDARRRAEIAFAQQPDLGREPARRASRARASRAARRTGPPTADWCRCAT